MDEDKAKAEKVAAAKKKVAITHPRYLLDIWPSHILTDAAMTSLSK